MLPGVRSAAVVAFGRCSLVAAVVKTVVLLIDHVPRFFFGDSESYLGTELHGYIPDDRSWLYGVAVNPLIDWANSLQVLLVIQTVAGALACGIVGSLLVSPFGAPQRRASIVAAVLAAEPLGLWYERSVLTETLGGLAWLVAVAMAVHVLVRPRLDLALAAALAGTLAIALRSAFILPVVTLALAGGVIAVARLRRRQRRAALIAAMLPLAIIGGIAAVASITGSLTDSSATLNPRDGYLLLGVVAPMLEEEDFNGLPVDGGQLLWTSGHEMRRLRNAQLYLSFGLLPRLERELGDRDLVSEAASRVARRAIRRDPVGFAALMLRQAVEYADPGQASGRFEVWAGLDNEIEPKPRARLVELTGSSPPPDAPMRQSVVRSWLEVMRWWPAVAYVASVGASGLGTRPPRCASSPR